jgi:uncharacterized protein
MRCVNLYALDKEFRMKSSTKKKHTPKPAGILKANGSKILNLFVREMRRRLGGNLVHLILFGSRARGDFVKDSDYDCLAVMKKISPKVEDLIDEISGDMLFLHNAVFFVIPMLVPAHQKPTQSPLLLNINKEGVTLWKQKAA